MKKILLTFCLVLMAVSSYAVKANPSAITIIQSDGTPLTVYLHGDEDFNWYSDAQGNILVRNGNDFEGISMSKAAFFEKARLMRNKNRMRRIGIGSTTPSYFPHTGSPKAVVILVQFPQASDTDSVATFSVADPQKTFNDYLNCTDTLVNYGNNESRNYGSVWKYFSDMSNSQFTPQFDVVGPYTVSQPESYYGQNSSSRNDVNIAQLVKEACNLADDDVDFSQYDSDGDGNVDLVYIIYAGYSESNGAPAETIWPQSSVASGITVDGKNVRRYGVNNELNYYPGYPKTAPYRRVNGIGLFCHEFSHTLGLPDLYSGLAVNNQEMEYWDLMDGGEYTDNGFTPTPYTPWEKEVMGWTSLSTLSDDSTKVTLQPDSALKITDASTSQYVILHNIQNTGWSSKLLGHGMLVYRIDYPYTTVNISDRPNSTSGEPAVTIIPADSLLISSYNVGDGKEYTSRQYFMSHYGDPFPGSENVDSLLSFNLNDDVVLNKPLYNITENSSTGVITFEYLKKIVTSISSISKADDETSKKIYTLDGRYVGTDISSLPKGIYIVGHKKVVL